MTPTENRQVKQEFFRMADIAKMLGVSVSTLKFWRRKGNFPTPLKVSSRVALYRISEVNEWIEQQKKG
ncbi:helix-turn-helix transcriptional regulator [Vibrio barjaei]|uniref:helix-turn-helix transcriptional regulator n=1 Tax=Vibrio barjaei TaxID=1676683 RepID=UPI0022842339|nr:helix-turn-helix domain-containing protein [Vibrio barjaei]MCY9873217.1 helix-turn-helix domain-containing protein [Vibrio barjaei]